MEHPTLIAAADALVVQAELAAVDRDATETIALVDLAEDAIVLAGPDTAEAMDLFDRLDAVNAALGFGIPVLTA